MKPFTTILLSFLASCFGGILVLIFVLRAYNTALGSLTDWIGVILLGVTLWQAKLYFDREHATIFVVKHDPVRLPKPNGIRVTPTSDGANFTVDPPKEWPEPGMNVWCENVGDIRGIVTFIGLSMDSPESKKIQDLDCFVPENVRKTEKVTPSERSSSITLTNKAIGDYFQPKPGFQYSYYTIYQAENKKIYWDEFQLTI